MTLTELLVYMVILAIALAIALAAVLQMSKVLFTTTGVAEASNSLWRATGVLERQVRNASAISVPGGRGSDPSGVAPGPDSDCSPGGDCFVEFLIRKRNMYGPSVCPACSADDDICVQWWTDTNDGSLYWRWWNNVADPVRSVPQLAANGLVAGEDPAFQPGFGDDQVVTFPLQRLIVDLTAQSGDLVSHRRSQYTARNWEDYYQRQVAYNWSGATSDDDSTPRLDGVCTSTDRNPS